MVVAFQERGQARLPNPELISVECGKSDRMAFKPIRTELDRSLEVGKEGLPRSSLDRVM